MRMRMRMRASGSWLGRNLLVDSEIGIWEGWWRFENIEGEEQCMGFSLRACWTELFRLVALGSRSSSTGLEEYYSCVTDR